jgi:hypothetical protein
MVFYFDSCVVLISVSRLPSDESPGIRNCRFFSAKILLNFSDMGSPL